MLLITFQFYNNLHVPFHRVTDVYLYPPLQPLLLTLLSFLCYCVFSVFFRLFANLFLFLCLSVLRQIWSWVDWCWPIPCLARKFLLPSTHNWRQFNKTLVKCLFLLLSLLATTCPPTLVSRSPPLSPIGPQISFVWKQSCSILANQLPDYVSKIFIWAIKTNCGVAILLNSVEIFKTSS